MEIMQKVKERYPSAYAYYDISVREFVIWYPDFYKDESQTGDLIGFGKTEEDAWQCAMEISMLDPLII